MESLTRKQHELWIGFEYLLCTATYGFNEELQQAGTEYTNTVCLPDSLKYSVILQTWTFSVYFLPVGLSFKIMKTVW